MDDDLISFREFITIVIISSILRCFSFNSSISIFSWFVTNIIEGRGSELGLGGIGDGTAGDVIIKSNEGILNGLLICIEEFKVMSYMICLCL
jgi:hypothetical protein